MINRRRFLGTVAAASTITSLRAQAPSPAASETPVPASPAPDWGGPVFDNHLHLRRGLDANMVHMKGCGVSHADLLSRDNSAEQVHQIQAKYPGKFVWSAGTNVANPDAADVLTKAVKDGGAVGLGELKSHVLADGPELQRMFALAAELNVPILVHFQEVDHFPGEGKWSSGYKRFDAMLKKYPKTTFVGHADAFWANVSADYAEQAAYPTGPIKRGGITDKWLSDYPNLFGCLSANSGNNALTRDPEFTGPFLARHQDKLIFGSDCACTDGNGGGVSQQRNPTASRLADKCVARETLAVLKKNTTPAIFRKLTWENAGRVYRLKLQA
jgi:predicted TIM-barrel fold metal-dependent hydrolase